MDIQTASRGKCPACDSTVVALTKRDGKIVIIVRCKCATHPDDVVIFDLDSLVAGLEEKETVYIHKGNSIIH